MLNRMPCTLGGVRLRCVSWGELHMVTVVLASFAASGRGEAVTDSCKLYVGNLSQARRVAGLGF